MHLLCGDAQRRQLYVVESTAQKLRKYDAKGHFIWEKSDLKAHAAALDPQSGNLWVLTSDELVFGKALVVVDPNGQKLHEYEIAGYDIVYSPHDKCFWVVGQNLVKVGLDGKIIC